MLRLPAIKIALLAIALLALPALAYDVWVNVSTTPTPNVPSLPPAPTAGTVGNIITNAVTARDAQGDNFDPVGITDAFPADQEIFHTIVTISNAPANTAVKGAWQTITGAKMGEFELQSDGSRNLDFTFAPDAGKLPAGNYKVDIFVDGKLDRTLNFSVAGGTGANPIQPATAAPKPSGFIASVTMAEDTQGENKDPVNPTTTFKTNAIFHAVVGAQNAPANTKFGARWFALDVGIAAAPNSLIDETELVTYGTRNIDFTLKPTTPWPPGTFRVEIYVNGVLDTIKNFSVK